MSSDLELVKYILSHLNSNELYRVSHLVSPDIIMRDEIQDNMCFEDYIRYVSEMSKIVELDIRDIVQHNNSYAVQLGLNIVDNSMLYYSRLTAKAIFTIHNNLLCEYEISYNGSEQDYAYMHKTKDLYNLYCGLENNGSK